MAGRVVNSVATDPGVPSAPGLIGARAASGFRVRLSELMPEEQAARSLLYLLLDDVPGATLVSGYAVGAAGRADTAAAAGYRTVPDLCSGFRTGGTIMLSVEKTGRPPMVTGPVAPALERPDDPDGWHPMAAMQAGGMRRRRLLDVTAVDESGLAVVSMFRDSHLSVEGEETIIHEYKLTAEVDSADWRITHAVATPQVLPWVECPSAAGSAQRLIGRTIHDLRAEVRAEFSGISTCTHLNDQMRSLTDVLALAPHCG
jgi:hypothetical protein